MRRGVVVVVALVGLVLSGCAFVTRSSVRSNGTQGDAASLNVTTSGDGRLVAFESTATNLVAGDTNGAPDIFVRDHGSPSSTTRTSVTNTGGQASGGSRTPAISENGRYVSFYSTATNLVAGDTNAVGDVFVRDRTGATTERVSVATGGTQANAISSDASSISADGQYVAFASSATNLVPGDTNGTDDVFVRDRTGATTERVSVATGGTQSTGGGSLRPSISADGRLVAFHSDATNLVTGDTNAVRDVFVHDRDTDTTERISVSSSEVQGAFGSLNPSISGDGAFVAFQSSAINLVSGDTNGVGDVFLRDRGAGTTARVSVSSSEAQVNGISTVPSVGDDGRYVAFQSAATNVVTGDTNGVDDVFVRDRVTGRTHRASQEFFNAQGNGASSRPSMSSDGDYVGFHTAASNLIASDTNGVTDVYLKFAHDTGPLSVVGTDEIPRGTTRQVTVAGSWFDPDENVQTQLNPSAGITIDNIEVGDPNDTIVYTLTVAPDANLGTRTVQLANNGPAWNANGGGAADCAACVEIVADTTPPTFTDTSGNFDVGVGNDAELTATVTDANGVESVTAFYREIGAGTFTPQALTNTSGDDWATTITAPTDDLEYYLEAEDEPGNTATSPIGAPGTLYLVTVGGPAGTITVNSGATYTTSTGVTLTLDASDEGTVTDMRIADGPDPTGASWEPYETSKGWTLPGGDGTKTVSVQFRDDESHISPVATDTIILDTTNPTAALSINSGAAYAMAAGVTLTTTSTDANGVTDMRVADGTDPTGASWESYAASKPWTLPGADGTKTVSVQYRDAAGNVSAVATDAIVLDTTVPTGTVAVAFGDADTASVHVYLDLDATDTNGVVDYRAANGADPSAAPWRPFDDFAPFTLSAGDGTKTVSVQYRDAAGNISTVATDTIDFGVAASYVETVAPSIEAVSSDGRYVVFDSFASDLVPGDTNGVSDVFVRDLQTGVTERVSVATGGAQGTDDSVANDISDDGRYVAFESEALELVGLPTDYTDIDQIYVHDRQTGITEIVSVNECGDPANHSNTHGGRISEDGQIVAFTSQATNLNDFCGGGGSFENSFVRDRQAATMTWIRANSGAAPGGNTTADAVSADGRYVALSTTATNLIGADPGDGVFVHDLQTSVSERVSYDDFTFSRASISSDNRYVVFSSEDGTIVPGDTNGAVDVFVYDRDTSTTERVSVASDGTEANDDNCFFNSIQCAVISDDGRYVAFDSTATNLVPGDPNGDVADVLLHDRQTGRTARVVTSSATFGGEKVAGITGDGRYVVTVGGELAYALPPGPLSLVGPGTVPPGTTGEVTLAGNWFDPANLEVAVEPAVGYTIDDVEVSNPNDEVVLTITVAADSPDIQRRFVVTNPSTNWNPDADATAVCEGEDCLGFSDGAILQFIGNDPVWLPNDPSSRGSYVGFANAADRHLDIRTVMPTDLSPYECVALPVNRDSFTPAQIDSLDDYLVGGGTVLALGEDSTRHDGANAVMEALATALGADLQLTNGTFDGTGFATTTNISSVPPWTTGVASLRYGNTSRVDLTGDAQLVASTVAGVSFLARDSVGSGSIFLSGDTNWISNFSDTGYTSQDNGILAANLCG